MRPLPHAPNAPKRELSLAVNGALLAMAERIGIDTAGGLESALASEVRERLRADM